MPRDILQGKSGLPRYSMLIQWSDEDQAYLVTLPEWAGRVLMPVTHGDTYDEAVKNGQEVLNMLMDDAQEDGEALPLPRLYTDHVVVGLPYTSPSPESPSP